MSRYAYVRAGRSRLLYATLACLPALMFTACGEAAQSGDGGTAVESGPARFDASLEDQACSLVSTDMVASVFGVPAAEIEQSSLIASRCAFEWEGNDETLAVLVRVDDVAEDTAGAERTFNNATRSMSAEQVSDAMAAVRDEAEARGDIDTAIERQTAEAVTSGVGSGGLAFEDVEGVGDQARLDTQDGSLTVRVDNLRFTVEAYKGPDMPTPDQLSVESVRFASQAWMADTLPQRRDAAAELARAIIGSL